MPGPVVHTCNRSKLGDWWRRIPSPNPASEFSEALAQHKTKQEVKSIENWKQLHLVTHLKWMEAESLQIRQVAVLVRTEELYLGTEIGRVLQFPSCLWSTIPRILSFSHPFLAPFHFSCFVNVKKGKGQEMMCREDWNGQARLTVGTWARVVGPGEGSQPSATLEYKQHHTDSIVGHSTSFLWETQFPPSFS